MSSREAKEASAFNRVLAVSLVLGLALTNSALFYFVIWDMFSPSKPFAAILFFVSGGAHLVYFFLPWFVRAMLAPIFHANADEVRRFDGNATRLAPQHDNPFVTLCTIFGIGLCVAALGLMLVQLDLGREEPESLALITKANCLEIGGTPEYVDGKLLCIVPKGEIHGRDALLVGRSSNDI